jgi:hypothetical protein
MPYNHIGFSKPGGSNGERLFCKEKGGIFRILVQCTIYLTHSFHFVSDVCVAIKFLLRIKDPVPY